MRRRLPPLSTLEGFEAAARLGSFAAAAEALNLTQSAVSHQVRLLEESLGLKLFRRLHRRAVLTDAGRDFHHSVGLTLGGLQEGVDRLKPYTKPGSVVVYCDPALANSWLVPRLPAFVRRHPAIDIWLDTTGRAVDFERDEVDVLIRRQEQTAPLLMANVRHAILFRETLRPAAAPALARRLRRKSLAASLIEEVMLHEEGFDGWPIWFKEYAGSRGEVVSDLVRGPNFSDPYVLLRMAVAGTGVALASDVLASPFIESRSLTWVAQGAIESPFRYIAAVSENGLTDPDVAAVFQWVSEEAGVDTRR
jgi:LysR family transcriptional regulator, glycine cleavage system transcriptional activator